MAEHRPFVAANWKILSIVAFAIVNAIVKILSSNKNSIFGVYASLPVAELIFFQYIISSLLLLPVVKHQKISLPQTHRLAHISRIGLAICGIFFWAQGIKYLPLGQCVALGFLSPVFSVLGAWIFLNEKLNTNRIYAILLSTTGAIIITNPFEQLIQHTLQAASLYPIAGSLCFAADKILNRHLSNKGEKAINLTFFLVAGVAPIALILAMPGWVKVDSTHVPLLLLMGSCSALSNFALIKSCELADISYITPLGLFKFIINISIGSLIFFEYSTNLSLWLGTSFVLLSVFLLTNEKRSPQMVVASR